MSKKPTVQENHPTAWFEELYVDSNTKGEGVPWANMGTHPFFSSWLKNHKLKGIGNSALVVGCGMGDDAIALEFLEFQVTAFDVSETAIKYCQERFPKSKVNFLQTNLFDKLPQWEKKFDFVLEIYTIQALPPKYEKQVIKKISDFVAPKGQLLVITEVGKEERSFANGPPWILTPEHINSFASCGLEVAEKHIGKGRQGNDVYVTSFKSPGK